MPFTRATFDDFKRLLDLYCKEVAVPTATVEVLTVDRAHLRVLKVLDVTETAVMLQILDAVAGIPVEGGEENRNKTAVVLPYDSIRSLEFVPSQPKTPVRAGFAT